MALILITLTALAARLGEMQMLQHDQFSRVAMAQRVYTVSQEAPRGDILDRQGRLLAASRPRFRLFLLYPAYVEKGRPAPLLGTLARMLKLDEAALYRQAEEKIAEKRFFEPFLVKDSLTPAETALLVESRASLPGLYIDTHPERFYPGGELAAHMLGFVGPISPEEMDRQKGYLVTDVIGKEGLEHQYEGALRGKPGLLDLEVDAFFRPTNRTYLIESPRSGLSLKTTLDLNLQRTVEKALARTLNYVSTHPDYEGKWFRKTNAGAAVVMNVKTGAILAMASFPTFDPNLFTGVRTPATDDAIRKLFGDRLSPQLNRAVKTAYLPGSTWKMLTAASALEHGLVDQHETVFCAGVFTKVEPKKDWKLDGHGHVDVRSALAQSCNIYFYEMGYRLGNDRLVETALDFGFGSPLGIDLPGEASGCIPGARNAAEDCRPWKGGEVLSAAIGQGPTATPLQLARLAAVLANGGVKVQPHLVSALVDARGGVVKELTPPPQGNVTLASDHLKAIQDGMKAVTEWGTSARAFAGLPFTVAGKTGTAENMGTQNCDGDPACQFGVYVAYAPADRPEIAVAVVGERAGHGDSMNPVARAAIAQYLQAPLGPGDPLYLTGILDGPVGAKPRE